ncbi:hypothetical protein BT63DRAFT_55561 [Microthyrium microscopicum]|uniref:25S rRNA adenine-N(1) methyltransferase n=1 Tax=Microthyrium microscopicum TaxID=703497 RepID=A0A6A6U5T4_9PEZI|nr:hypothetical protein BT63DRAFT_55561 [Microthyrium microscopicum]
MGNKKTSSKRKSLSAGRPPLIQKPKATFSSKATRTIIRKHHNLLKAHAQAIKVGDDETAAELAQQLSEDGGLSKYQQASQIGQLNSRGGDTSKVLVNWLQESSILPWIHDQGSPLRVLEVGCLSPNNAISKVPNVEMERIDLHSTHPSIREQDFMKTLVPSLASEKFDLVSLSLVVNFVPEAAERGKMLQRTSWFLSHTRKSTESSNASAVLPCLFLTLPLPCVENSRYFTAERLADIMNSLGYELTHSKTSTKIFYSLWKFNPVAVKPKLFKKEEIVTGRSRNNFAITLAG